MFPAGAKISIVMSLPALPARASTFSSAGLDRDDRAFVGDDVYRHPLVKLTRGFGAFP